MTTFSVSVMAHTSRERYFPYLKERLGDVPFTVDSPELKLGTFENNRRAWQLRDGKSDYHLVIQDDAVLPVDFLERVQAFIEKHPNPAYQLFLGKMRNSWRPLTAERKGDFVEGTMMWGLAIMLRQDLIDEMLEWCADNFEEGYPDDTRIQKFLARKGIRTFYPYPSLVDHRDEQSLVGNGKIRRAERYVDGTHIPKIIHQIWIGDPAKMPRKWMATWDIEGWEHKIWTEKEIDALGLINRKQYDYYYKKGLFHGASDVARLEILERFGGMYIDADTERLRAFEGDYLYQDLFAVDESTMRAGLGERVANGIIGCQPHSPTIQEYIRRVGAATKLEPIWNTIGGTMFTQVIKDVAEPRVAILESFWFLPISYTGEKHPKWRDAIAVHHWGTTKKIYGKEGI